MLPAQLETFSCFHILIRGKVFPAHRWQGRWCHSKKRRKRTKFKENTIEIFQWKKEKKISVAGFYTDENGREVVRWWHPDSIVFYDAEVLLGKPQNNNQTKRSVRLVGYRVDGVDYWIATDRRDLTSEQIAKIYKLRWDIEKFWLNRNLCDA